MPFLAFSPELRLDVALREPVPPHLPLDLPLPDLLLIRVDEIDDLDLFSGGLM